jgi:hypothetical protein
MARTLGIIAIVSVPPAIYRDTFLPRTLAGTIELYCYDCAPTTSGVARFCHSSSGSLLMNLAAHTHIQGLSLLLV